METPTKSALYIAGKPGKDVVTVGHEIFFWPAHDYNFHYFGDPKQHKGHKPDTLRLRSTCFECTSGGNPVKWKDGLQLRRVEPEHQAQIQEIERQQRELAAKRQALLNLAWKEGMTVHISEAANYAEVMAKKSQPK